PKRHPARRGHAALPPRIRHGPAKQNPMNLALFDFDGTLTHGDCFVPFVRYSVPRLRYVAGAGALVPWIVGYRLGKLSGPAMRAAIVRMGFSGRNQGRVEQDGLEYASTLSRRIREEAARRLEWHQANGDEIVVVSASLDVYLKHWCRQVGAALVCSQLEAKGGRLTGRYAGRDCTGQEKARRVRMRFELGRYERIYAYGDTIEDRELLALAHE